MPKLPLTGGCLCGSVRMGTFDTDPGIRASYRAYVAYAAPWEPIPDDGLPRFLEARKS